MAENGEMWLSSWLCIIFLQYDGGPQSLSKHDRMDIKIIYRGGAKITDAEWGTSWTQFTQAVKRIPECLQNQ